MRWTKRNGALDSDDSPRVGCTDSDDDCSCQCPDYVFLQTRRVAASKQLTGPSGKYEGDTKEFINKIRDALYCSKICSYAQGMALLGKASKEFNYNLSLSETSRIWKGGCIIRAGFLDKIKTCFQGQPRLAQPAISA
jgi:6-phosphogluconate dehydrogenase